MKGITYTLFFLLIITLFIPITIEASTINATLQGVKGEVFVTKGGGKKEINAFNGMRVAQGDSLRTGSRSSVKIVFSSENEATLSSNAKVTIAQLASDNNENQTAIKQESGGLWSKVKSFFNAGDKYEVETSTSVMGVRGTLFYTLLDLETQGSQVRVLDGQVGVERTQGQPSEEEQAINSNQELSVEADEANSKASEVLDIKKFVEQLDADLFVTVVDDTLEVAEETESAAKKQLETYQEIGDKDQALLSLINANRAALLANLSNEILREVELSPKRQEFERALQDRGRNIQDVKQKASSVKEKASETRNQVSDDVQASGVASQEELDEINIPVEEQINESQRRQEEATLEAESTTQTGGSTGGGTTRPPTEPELNVTTTQFITAEKTVDISGTVTEGSVVQVFRGETELASTEAVDGTFSIEIPLIEGENTLEIRAIYLEESVSEGVTIVREITSLNVVGTDEIIVPISDNTSTIEYHAVDQHGDLISEGVNWGLLYNSDVTTGDTITVNNNIGIFKVTSEETTANTLKINIETEEFLCDSCPQPEVSDTFSIRATLIDNEEISDATEDIVLVAGVVRTISGSIALSEPAPEEGLTVYVYARPIVDTEFNFEDSTEDNYEGGSVNDSGGLEINLEDEENLFFTELEFLAGDQSKDFSIEVMVANFIEGYNLLHNYQIQSEENYDEGNYDEENYYSESGTVHSYEEADMLSFVSENPEDIGGINVEVMINYEEVELPQDLSISVEVSTDGETYHPIEETGSYSIGSILKLTLPYGWRADLREENDENPTRYYEGNEISLSEAGHYLLEVDSEEQNEGMQYNFIVTEEGY